MSDTMLASHGLRTARASGYFLRESVLDPGDCGEELRGWYVVAHVIEANLFWYTNLEAAYEKLRRFNHNGQSCARLLTDPGYREMLLLVDPDHEGAVHIAASLAKDISLGAHIEPHRFNMAAVAKADELWAGADLPKRIDWLLGTTESLDRAFGNDCPFSAAQHIVEFCRL